MPITTTQQQQEVVIVHLDHQFGSTLLNNVFISLNNKQFKINSTIIIKDNIFISNEIIHHTKHNQSLPPQLLYRGSRDGFKDIDFHSRCDNQGPTLTLIKTIEPTNQIFGGFTTQSWKSPPLDDDRWIPDDSAFLFKIEYDKNSNQSSLFRKFNIKQSEKQYAIYIHSNYLPTFGAGYDICICSDCNLIDDSFTQFGDTYETTSTTTTTLSNDKEGSTPGIKFDVTNEKYYLSGGGTSAYFTVSEIEVFKINITNHNLNN